MPRMVTTARMVDAMRTVLRDRSIPQEDRDLLERYGPTAEWYPMDVVELLLRRLPTRQYLHELLAGSSVAAPDPLPAKKRNPELEKRLQQIRAELEEREYEDLTRDIRKEEFAQREAGEIVTLSASIGEGVNILVTKGTFFAVAYCASLAAWGSDPVKNISAGLVGLIIGFFVETTLFVLRSSSTIREHERQRKARVKRARGITRASGKAAAGIPLEFREAVWDSQSSASTAVDDTPAPLDAQS